MAAAERLAGVASCSSRWRVVGPVLLRRPAAWTARRRRWERQPQHAQQAAATVCEAAPQPAQPPPSLLHHPARQALQAQLLLGRQRRAGHVARAGNSMRDIGEDLREIGEDIIGRVSATLGGGKGKPGAGRGGKQQQGQQQQGQQPGGGAPPPGKNPWTEWSGAGGRCAAQLLQVFFSCQAAKGRLVAGVGGIWAPSARAQPPRACAPQPWASQGSPMPGCAQQLRSLPCARPLPGVDEDWDAWSGSIAPDLDDEEDIAELKEQVRFGGQRAGGPPFLPCRRCPTRLQGPGGQGAQRGRCAVLCTTGGREAYVHSRPQHRRVQPEPPHAERAVLSALSLCCPRPPARPPAPDH